MKKTYNVNLTERELWALKCGFEASITDPDSMNAAEKSAMKKLDKVWTRAHNDLKTNKGST